jgi:hypothetical protein
MYFSISSPQSAFTWNLREERRQEAVQAQVSQKILGLAPW